MVLRFDSLSVGRTLVIAALCLLIPVWCAAVEVGDDAPAFTLTDLDGFTHALTEYASQPVLLMFLSCDSEVSIGLAPLVQSDFYRVFVPRGLRILGIECQGNTHEELTQFRNQTGITFPLLLDGAATLTEYDLPMSSFVVVDGTGKVRFVSRGPDNTSYDPAAMGEMIDRILREASALNEATWGLIKSLYSK